MREGGGCRRPLARLGLRNFADDSSRLTTKHCSRISRTGWRFARRAPHVSRESRERDRADAENARKAAARRGVRRTHDQRFDDAYRKVFSVTTRLPDRDVHIWPLRLYAVWTARTTSSGTFLEMSSRSRHEAGKC